MVPYVVFCPAAILWSVTFSSLVLFSIPQSRISAMTQRQLDALSVSIEESEPDFPLNQEGHPDIAESIMERLVDTPNQLPPCEDSLGPKIPSEFKFYERESGAAKRKQPSTTDVEGSRASPKWKRSKKNPPNTLPSNNGAQFVKLPYREIQQKRFLRRAKFLKGKKFSPTHLRETLDKEYDATMCKSLPMYEYLQVNYIEVLDALEMNDKYFLRTNDLRHAIAKEKMSKEELSAPDVAKLNVDLVPINKKAYDEIKKMQPEMDERKKMHEKLYARLRDVWVLMMEDGNKLIGPHLDIVYADLKTIKSLSS